MSIFQDMVSNIKKVVMTDDAGFLDEDPGYFASEEKKSIFPNFKKKNQQEKLAFPNFSNQGNYNLNEYDYNIAKQANNLKREKQGHIQVFLPKNFDESFDIIKSIESGVTAMVNVEATNQQTASRIIDVISGAMFALKGQCKKIGEKQYIFTLNAELTGAIDFMPGQNNQYSTREQYQGFDMQNPFSFTSVNQNINNQNQQYGYQQQQQYNNQYQNQGYSQPNFDYVKPQNQF